MSQPASGSPEETGPLFDVVVRMPSGLQLEDVERLARDAAGIAPDRVASLIKALRNGPQVKIGAGVNKERADKAKAQFTKAGLTVDVTPLLAIQALTTGSFDGLYSCPACAKRVTLPDNRQCPACGVFVDKVTDEFLLKKKIMEQERAGMEFRLARDGKAGEQRTRESMEGALRAKIREELEKEYGLRSKAGLFEGKGGLFRGLGLVGLVAAAFVGGNAMSPGGFSVAKLTGGASSSAKGTSAADVDKMLDSVGPKSAGPAGAPGTPGAAGALTGDADIDDPLIQAAGGKRIGAKGLTMEEAVAAATSIAKLAGNTTAERAMGAGNPPRPGAPGAPEVPGAATGGAGVAPAPVPKLAKLILRADFAKHLAELGQGARAREVLKALKASPDLASEPVAASAARIADIEIQAWALQTLSESRARQAADTLKNNAAALSDSAERAQALARAGAIVSRNPQMPPEVAQAFLTLAAESLKSVGDARQRTQAVGEWATALGEVLLAETTARASGGHWTRAQAAGGQVDGLIPQAPDPLSQARLFAIQYQVKKILGQPDGALQSLEGALAVVARSKSPAEQAAWLRSVAQLSGAASHERIQGAVTALAAQLEAAPGLERAQGFMHLSLLHADAGLRSKAEQFRNLAQATAGLSPADTVAVNSGLVVRGDMAAARALHSAGQYAEAEVVLQRVGGYLL